MRKTGLTPRRSFLLPASVGALAGIALVAWLFWPPGPLRLQFVQAGTVVDHTSIVDSLGSRHEVTEWRLQRSQDVVMEAATKELKQSQGWQPPTEVFLKSTDPRPEAKNLAWQFVRVNDERGDFQFDRVVIRGDGANQTLVTLDAGPTGRGVLRK